MNKIFKSSTVKICAYEMYRFSWVSVVLVYCSMITIGVISLGVDTSLAYFAEQVSAMGFIYALFIDNPLRDTPTENLSTKAATRIDQIRVISASLLRGCPILLF
jgi:hypothetical protein